METAKLKKLVDTVAGLGKPTLLPFNFEDPGKIKCACGIWKSVLELPYRYSGFVKYTDNVCRGCEKDYRGLCRLVCAHCKTIVGHIKPHKDQHDFHYKPDVTYHLDSCQACKDHEVAGTPSIILEKIIFLRDKFGDQYKPY